MIKTIVVLYLTFCFFVTSGMAPRNTVVITAKDVIHARDIEAAIDLATGNGAHPGRVILDSRDGDFVYTEADKSINIYYPNVTLISKNGAVLANCNDGIFFDDLPTDNTWIEGITFVCDSNGVVGWMTEENAPERVTIKNNTFNVQSFGIGIAYVKNWNIFGNTISTEGMPIQIYRSKDVRIAQNKLSGFIGVFLWESNGNKVSKNTLEVAWQGVLIGYGSDENKVLANLILGPQISGISMEGGNFGNTIIGNKVACGEGYECEVVGAYPEAYEANKIKGNIYCPKP